MLFTFIPSGVMVPILCMSQCSRILRSAQSPLTNQRPCTLKSFKECPAWQKCRATGYLKSSSVMFLMCSLTLSSRERKVSPTYSMLQETHLTTYTMFEEVHVKGFLMWKEDLAPWILSSLSRNGQLRQRARLQGRVPG